MQLFLEIDPSTLSTAQQKGERVVRGYIRHYIKPNVKRSQERMESAIVRAWKKNGGKTRTVYNAKRRKLVEVCVSSVKEKEPVYSTITVCFPYRKDTPARFRKERIPVPMVERPDLDNILKGLQDALVAVRIIPDDSQVVSLSSIKFRSVEPFIGVCLWTQEQVDRMRRGVDADSEEPPEQAFDL